MEELVSEEEIKLLKQMSSGITIFEPYLRTSAELTKFQEMARLLLGLEERGLIYKCFVTQFHIAGADFYDLVHIPRGLTPKGEEVLRRHTGSKTPD